jgi:hypothetical protein
VEFAKSPDRYIGNVGARLDGNTRGEHGHAHAATDAITVIDVGIRQWYKSCRCWPSGAHPEVVKIRDAERATPTVGA